MKPRSLAAVLFVALGVLAIIKALEMVQIFPNMRALILPLLTVVLAAMD